MTASSLLVAVDLGTFCDHGLVIAALKHVDDAPRRRRVTYVTDARNNTQLPAARVVRYVSPPFLTGDDGMALADPAQSLVFWGLLHPQRAIQARGFSQQLSRLVLDALDADRRPDDAEAPTLLLSYPACAALLPALDELVQRRPSAVARIVVLAYAPAFPNATVPWPFDSRLAQPRFRLYRTSPAYNVASSLGYYERAAGWAASGSGAALRILTSPLLTFLACWDLGATRPIEPMRGIRVVETAPLVPHDPTRRRLPRTLACALADDPGQPRRRRALVTFGSFSDVPLVRDAARALLRLLLDAVDQVVLLTPLRSLAGLLPASSSAARAELVLHDADRYVSYAALVPRVDLVVFTGSLCLQNACLAHGVPMLFVPLLTEQHFWARNYEARAGVPAVDPRRLAATLPPDGATLVETWTLRNPRVAEFLRAVRASRGGGRPPFGRTLRRLLDGNHYFLAQL